MSDSRHLMPRVRPVQRLAPPTPQCRPIRWGRWPRPRESPGGASGALWRGGRPAPPYRSSLISVSSVSPQRPSSTFTPYTSNKRRHLRFNAGILVLTFVALPVAASPLPSRCSAREQECYPRNETGSEFMPFLLGHLTARGEKKTTSVPLRFRGDSWTRRRPRARAFAPLVLCHGYAQPAASAQPRWARL